MKVHMSLFLFLMVFYQMSYAESESFLNKYSFDWYNPNNSKCLKVDSVRDKALRSFTCRAAKHTFGGDEKPSSMACKDKNGKAEFLFYETEKDCKNARETLLANGD